MLFLGCQVQKNAVKTVNLIGIICAKCEKFNFQKNMVAPYRIKQYNESMGINKLLKGMDCMKKSKKLLLLAVMSASMLISGNVFAEGSRDLIKNGGNRPYLEWYEGTTLGITRKNTMNVFARAGEKILIGSSVYKAYDNTDIAVVFPNGETETLDVIRKRLESFCFKCCLES